MTHLEVEGEIEIGTSYHRPGSGSGDAELDAAAAAAAALEIGPGSGDEGRLALALARCPCLRSLRVLGSFSWWTHGGAAGAALRLQHLRPDVAVEIKLASGLTDKEWCC